MTHGAKFLQLVEDAKSRIQETTVAEVKSDLDAAADFTLIDTREESEWAASRAAGAMPSTSARALSSVTSKRRYRTPRRRSFSIVEADSVPRLPPMRSKRWATAMSTR